MNTPRMLSLLAAVTLLLAVGAAAAYGHAERLSYYPNHKLGEVPKYRTTGKALVVCKSDSGRRIRRLLNGKAERRNLKLLDRCRYRHIQSAVNAAKKVGQGMKAGGEDVEKWLQHIGDGIKDVDRKL